MRRDWRERLFVAVGAGVAALPRLRGKAHAALLLHRALGLTGRRTLVEAQLRRPVRYRAELDLGSWLQRLAFVTGEYESDTVTFLLRLRAASGADGYVLDIGANVGLIAVPAALLLRTCNRGARLSVVAIEAVRDNAAALRGNIARNCVQTECLAIESAVGDEDRPVEIQVEGDLREGQGSGTANIVADDSDYACERIPLQLTTLDALAASSALPTGCSVVKIDTDGYDLKVLQGGRGFVGTERPVVFGEFLAHCMRWHHQGLAEVVSHCDSLGYAVWQRLPGGWSFTRGVDERVYEQDLLLVPREKEGRFEWCLSGREVGR